MTTSAQLILVPYDCARRGVRMGGGPHALVAAGIAELLDEEEMSWSVAEVAPEADFQAEISTAFDLQRGVRREVAAALANGTRPITLSNCNTGVVGSLAAIGASDIGLIWFDAHFDAETPESSTSGFLDGMGLGWCSVAAGVR